MANDGAGTADELYIAQPASTSKQPLPAQQPAEPPLQPPGKVTNDRVDRVIQQPATIAGLAIGSIALLALVVLLGLVVRHRRRSRREARQDLEERNIMQARQAAQRRSSLPKPLLAVWWSDDGRVPVEQPNGEVCVGQRVDCELKPTSALEAYHGDSARYSVPDENADDTEGEGLGCTHGAQLASDGQPQECEAIMRDEASQNFHSTPARIQPHCASRQLDIP